MVQYANFAVNWHEIDWYDDLGHSTSPFHGLWEAGWANWGSLEDGQKDGHFGHTGVWKGTRFSGYSAYIPVYYDLKANIETIQGDYQDYIDAMENGASPPSSYTLGTLNSYCSNLSVYKANMTSNFNNMQYAVTDVTSRLAVPYESDGTNNCSWQSDQAEDVPENRQVSSVLFEGSPTTFNTYSNTANTQMSAYASSKQSMEGYACSAVGYLMSVVNSYGTACHNSLYNTLLQAITYATTSKATCADRLDVPNKCAEWYTTWQNAYDSADDLYTEAVAKKASIDSMVASLPGAIVTYTIGSSTYNLKPIDYIASMDSIKASLASFNAASRISLLQAVMADANAYYCPP